MSRKVLGPATLATVQAVEALPPGPWIVACSGGADSLALAWAAAFVGRRRGTTVRAIVIDHGLQANSDAVASSVAATLAALPAGPVGAAWAPAVDQDGSAVTDPLRSLGDARPTERADSASRGPALTIPTTVVRVHVAADGLGPEASAREARYAALEASAEPGERVLLGHTLDDQAETVLLGLARGSGARSLAGMPPERGIVLRPLLGVTREATRAACAELGLTPWEDPHNADDRYARVRVRTRVLPTLERELGPGVREALARTAEQLRRDVDILDADARAALASALVTTVSWDADPSDAAASHGRPTTDGAETSASGTQPTPDETDASASGQAETLNCRWLAGLDPAIRDRVLYAWLSGRGASDVSATHVSAVVELVTQWRGQRGVDLPGVRITRRDGRLIADRRSR